MGLDVYISYPEVDAGKDLQSELYPEHMCNRSYLRSSYNDGGFNSVVGRLIGKDWYYVFGLNFGGVEDAPGYVPYDEETETGGDWYPPTDYLRECLKRAEEVVAELKAINRPLRTFDVSVGNMFAPNDEPACTAEEAIQHVYTAFAKYDEQMEKYQKGELKHEPFGGYSGREGTFHLDQPIPVVAFVPGKSVLNMPCVHVVYEAKDMDWYIQAAEITVEMIQTMIDNPGASICWSA